MTGWWRPVWLVAEREIRERGRSRAFLGSSAFMLLLIVGVVALSGWAFTDDDPYDVALVGPVPAGIEEILRAAAQAEGGVELDVREIDTPGMAETALTDGDLDAVLIGPDELVVHERAPNDLRNVVDTAVRQALLAERLVQAGIDDRQVTRLIGGAPVVEVRALEPETTEEEGSRLLVSVIGLVLLLMAIMMYGQWVLMSVVEEKSSRIVEVLLGTLRPHHLLGGKVLGMGLLGLAQLLLLLVVGGIVALFIGVGEMPDTTVPLIVSVVFWFIVGYVFFSVAFAVVGATVSRQEDASNASTPVTLVVMATYFTTLFVLLRDPDGLLAQVLSIVPPFSPMAMPARIGMGEPAIWEIALAVALVVPAVYGLLRLGGRLYTGAVLRTGPRVSLGDAWRSARDVSARGEATAESDPGDRRVGSGT